MVDVFKIISVVAFTLAGVTAVTSIALFFLLKVKKSIEVISGRAAKKSIEQMKNDYVPSNNQPVYSYSGKVSATEELPATEILPTEDMEATMVLESSDETVVLGTNNYATTSSGYIKTIKQVVYIHTNVDK